MVCKKWIGEFIGTFWLVLGGCGTAVMMGQDMGLAIAIAFGLSILTMGHVIGPISGCHLNPAVTLAMVVGGRFQMKDAFGYIIVQVLGAVVAAWVIAQIAGGADGWSMSPNGLFANGFAEHSPGGYSMNAVLLCEVLMTAMFVFIIMGSNSPMVMGLTLALIYLIMIPVTGGSINPARATGPAVIMGGWAISQLWLFWVAPIVGGILGAVAHRELANCQ